MEEKSKLSKLLTQPIKYPEMLSELGNSLIKIILENCKTDAIERRRYAPPNTEFLFASMDFRLPRAGGNTSLAIHIAHGLILTSDCTPVLAVIDSAASAPVYRKNYPFRVVKIKMVNGVYTIKEDELNGIANRNKLILVVDCASMLPLIAKERLRPDCEALFQINIG